VFEVFDGIEFGDAIDEVIALSSIPDFVLVKRVSEPEASPCPLVFSVFVGLLAPESASSASGHVGSPGGFVFDLSEFEVG